MTIRRQVNLRRWSYGFGISSSTDETICIDFLAPFSYISRMNSRETRDFVFASRFLFHCDSSPVTVFLINAVSYLCIVRTPVKYKCKFFNKEIQEKILVYCNEKRKINDWLEANTVVS